MKSELEYLRLALTSWCKTHRFSAESPLSGKEVLEILNFASDLRAADKKKLEDATV
jgi:hypothetical protein